MKNTEATPTTKPEPEMHRTLAGAAVACSGRSPYGPDHEATCGQYHPTHYFNPEIGWIGADPR